MKQVRPLRGREEDLCDVGALGVGIGVFGMSGREQELELCSGAPARQDRSWRRVETMRGLRLRAGGTAGMTRTNHSIWKQGKVWHAGHSSTYPRTQQAEAGGLPWTEDKPRLHRETLAPNLFPPAGQKMAWLLQG